MKLLLRREGVQNEQFSTMSWLVICLIICSLAVTACLSLAKTWQKGHVVQRATGRERSRREEDFCCVCVWFCLQHVTCASINSTYGFKCVFDMINKGFGAVQGNVSSGALTHTPILYCANGQSKDQTAVSLASSSSIFLIATYPTSPPHLCPTFPLTLPDFSHPPFYLVDTVTCCSHFMQQLFVTKCSL